MNLRNIPSYNVGLDIGTGSVGWAVTDENGNLCHFKNRPTWGSRIFPSANTAAETRLKRGQRRRYDRRRQRLDLLQSLFDEEMEKVDPEFFIRLRQSKLRVEDREEGHREYRYPFFNSSDFTERMYYKSYPTIYHLRKHLIESDQQEDLRLIYLAFHNIVKTRGNFLYQDTPSLSAKDASMSEAIEELLNALVLWADAAYDFEIDEVDSEKLRKVFEDSSLTRAEKKDEALKILTLEDKKIAKELINAVLGYKANFNTIFKIEAEKSAFSFDNDEQKEAFISSVPDEGMALYEALQKAYSAYILMDIIEDANGKSVSYSMVEKYNKYGEDLKTLKDLVKEYCPTKYSEFFRGEHYDAPYQKDYDKSKAKGYTKYNEVRGAKYDDFKKEVENLFKDTAAISDSRYKEMMTKFVNGKFLRRLKTSDNGSIPFQLHLEEMNAIVDAQEKFYPFLSDIRHKLNSLVTFRIPYYVGPLTQKGAALDASGKPRFAWSKRQEGKEGDKIYPWNWEEIIDKGASAREFIQRMTGTCTYLYGEPVLPKCSLLYEKFCVLNELNGARWSQDNDKWYRFDAEDRLSIYEELFERYKSVSFKKVEDWLKQRGETFPHVKGGQGEGKFESKLSSHHFFKELLGTDEWSDQTKQMIEELILWNTLFEDKKILKEETTKKYGDVLTAEQIKKFCGHRFTGWGRLSKKLLTGIKTEVDFRKMSVMDLLVEGDPYGEHVGSSLILMEILHNKNFEFNKEIEAHNEKYFSKDQSVEDLPGSPAVRRSVNQALRIVEEIEKIAGKPAAHIYIESTRDEDEKKRGKRTTKRNENIKKMLSELKEEYKNADIFTQLDKHSDEQLSKRLSLYFMQNGKSMYSGKAIEINLIADNTYCQIDHVLPQSYIKDDSFENTVLVLSEENQRKGDSLLLDADIRRKMAGLWHELHRVKLIGDKKYKNLTRSVVTDRQMEGFINRQLVETSQIVKFVRMLLKSQYPDTEICSIKASLSHEIREKYNLPKIREVNDYHHAHDAFLACEMGRFLSIRYEEAFTNPVGLTKLMRKFVKKESEEAQKQHRIPGTTLFFVASFSKPGFDLETGEVIKDEWNPIEEVEKIKRTFGFKQCFVSRMPEMTSGTFWDETVYSPKNKTMKLALPVKGNLLPEKYGSYSSIQLSFSAICRGKKKNKSQYYIVDIPRTKSTELYKNSITTSNYLAKVLRSSGVEFEELIYPALLKNQVIEYGGQRFYVVSSGELRNGVAPSFSYDDYAMISNYFDGNKDENATALIIYDLLSKTISSRMPVLADRLKLDSKRAAFSALDCEDSKKVLVSLLNTINGSKVPSDTTKIGGPTRTERICISIAAQLNKNPAEFSVIEQSVTGMFERRRRIGL